MPLPLDKTLKREIVLVGKPYTVTISPRGVKLTAKGFRKGRELTWDAFWAVAAPEGDPEPGRPTPAKVAKVAKVGRVARVARRHDREGVVPPAAGERGTT